MFTRCAAIRLLKGLFLAIAAFSLTNGISEFLLAVNSDVSIEQGGQHRAATLGEIVRSSLLGEIPRAVPFAAFTVLVLLLPLLLVSCAALRAPPTWRALVIVPVGALGGAALSMSAHVAVGGWGPPFFLPSVAGGAALGAALLRRS